MDNCILVDWLTFSSLVETKDSVIALLGLSHCHWTAGKASSLHYAHVVKVEGITVHYTESSDILIENGFGDLEKSKKYNPGICVEMSGGGCRFFESYSDKDFNLIFRVLAYGAKKGNYNVTRLDLAYDDFSGFIDINVMRDLTEKDYYTCVMPSVSITKSREKKDSDLWGLNIQHGKRESKVSFRIYDKRIERKQYDLEHWIRFEMQLRKEAALGFIQKLFLDENTPDIGLHFVGVIRRYLEYKCPGNDSNIARWKPAPWWLRFVGDVEKFSCIARKDLEYNKQRMDRYAYKQNHNHTLAEIEMDGLGAYLLSVHGYQDSIPDKYKVVASAAANSDEILRRLGEVKEESGLDYLRRCRVSLDSTISGIELSADLQQIIEKYDFGS